MPAPTPEMIALGRQRYVEGATISRIVGETGMSHGTLYYWLDGGPEGDERLPPIPRRTVALGKRRRMPKGDRVSVVARVWRTAELQVRDIEERVRLKMQTPEERERDARALAVLAKTLRDLRTLDETDEEGAGANDDGPGNIDDIRCDISRKIDAIIAEERADADRAPEQR